MVILYAKLWLIVYFGNLETNNAKNFQINFSFLFNSFHYFPHPETLYSWAH